MSKWKEWFQGPQDITKAEAIEDYAIGRVPKRYRWPIPAIILVLWGNSTAMFFFTYGAEFSYLAYHACSDLVFFCRSDGYWRMYDEDCEQGRIIDEPSHSWLGFRVYGLSDNILNLRDQLYLLFYIFEGTIVSRDCQCCRH